MDPAACRVVYIDHRFNAERIISREGLIPSSPSKAMPQADFSELPPDLQANVNAFLSVFNQVFVCQSGRSFSSKLSELHEQVQLDCTPILACFDVGSESKHDNIFRSKPRFFTGGASHDSPMPSPTALRREITFSSESEESYGLQLLSRIAADLQVEEGVKLIIPVAIVQPKRKDSYDATIERSNPSTVLRAPYGPETDPVRVEDKSDFIDPQLMLQCLDAGALDVVKSPLDKAGIMGLTVHAYRIYKSAKKEQAGFMGQARKRKQSWVGMEEEKPYAYLREAMVKKLLKGICEPQTVIEDFQFRELFLEDRRKAVIAREVGLWSFCGHDFNEDELVWAGVCMLQHALQMDELEKWRIDQDDLVHFMQGCRVAYNSFVLYHNFRHAVDVLQSTFYFLVQIGILPPYPKGAPPPPHSQDKSPIARLLSPFEALTLLISAIGHDVGHPGVNNMFLVKLNAPLAQLYNDQSVLEAFHCAAYSQILRRHWPVAFEDKGLRKLMISSILATDMGVHSDYMQQLGNLQEKIHESQSTDGWTPKDIDAFRVLTCGLLIKCADISNVARPWAVAEKWTHLLQQEFANQGEMEQTVGMETTLFGGPPEIGNVLKLANGQIGFMTIFAHPLFANVTDIIPAMGFAANEILTNKGVWFTRAEHEKQKQIMLTRTGVQERGGNVSPRSRSPQRRMPPHVDANGVSKGGNVLPSSPLRAHAESIDDGDSRKPSQGSGSRTGGSSTPRHRSSLAAAAGLHTPTDNPSPKTKANDSVEPTQDQIPSSEHEMRSHSAPNGGTPVGEGSSAPPTASVAAGETNKPEHVVSPSTKSPEPGPSIDAEGQVDGGGDHRRDAAMSMQAGSEAIPLIAASSRAEDDPSHPAAASKFTFATSNPDEPVRIYDPAQHYPPQHEAARATVPPIGSTHNTSGNSAGQGQEQSTANTTTAGGAKEGSDLTPHRSTEAPSSMSEREGGASSEGQTSSGNIAHQDNKKPPTRPLNNALRGSSYSMNSSNRSVGATSPTRNEGSENTRYDSSNFVAMSNGDIGAEDDTTTPTKSAVEPRKSLSPGGAGSNQTSGKSMGRRRSRLKLGLAFWKKKKSGEDGIGSDTDGHEKETDSFDTR